MSDTINIANQLDPEAHAQFLDVLFAATKSVVARNPDGKTLAVAGHYKSQWEQQKQALNAAPRRPRKPARK